MKHFVSNAETRRYVRLARPDDVAAEIIERDRKIQVMKKALMFYGDCNNWADDVSGEGYVMVGEIGGFGVRARLALDACDD